MLKNTRIVALASFIEGIIIIIWLASIPTGGGDFSPVRLLSMFTILLVSLGGLVIFVYAKPENKLVKQAWQLPYNRTATLVISLLLTTISFATWIMILYKDWALSIVDEAVYTRLLPIIVFGALLCLQAGILFLIPYVDKDTGFNIFGSVWKPALIVLGCFLAIWVLMSLTHIGFVYDNVGLSWGPPGTPVSFPQIYLVFAVSLILAFAYGIFSSRISRKIPVRDIVVFMGLWGLAVILWSNEPVSVTHFNPPLMEPNFEAYPNSDALIFDKSAYHLLYGTGFSEQLIRRPLYVGMLALFHKLGGSSYDNTILLQILILAFIPSLTYLLTSKISNRLAGLIAGGLILLREKNAIELSDKIVTSNAKLMMSDMIAMLGIIAFVYLMLKIFSQKERTIWMLGIAGACLGLTALVRAQVLILLPVVILFILFYKKPFAFRIKDSLLITLGLVLVMFPWVWRNWNLTGTFVLDDRGEERLLARNYSSDPVALPSPLPDETEKEFSARLKQGIVTFIVEHPIDAAFFISNHFFRNMATGTVYMAPFISTDSPDDIVDQTLFWESWKGTLNGNSSISIFVTLALVALGIAIAQGNNKHAGWFPLIVFLFYSAGNALVRSSGWRFSLPVDWVILVYYSIALGYFPSKLKLAFNGDDKVRSGIEVSTATHRSSLEPVVFCILLLMGASVPIAERLIPVRDFSNFTSDAKEKLSDDNILSPSEIETFLQQENAVFYSGMALYPRYIPLKSRVYLANTPRGYTFLHFWFINDDDEQVVLPIQSSPDVFPHTATVSIIGCKEKNYILAWAVIVHTPKEKVIIQKPRASLSCPLPEPK